MTVIVQVIVQILLAKGTAQVNAILAMPLSERELWVESFLRKMEKLSPQIQAAYATARLGGYDKDAARKGVAKAVARAIDDPEVLQAVAATAATQTVKPNHSARRNAGPPRHALGPPELRRYGLRPVREMFGEIVPSRSEVVVTGDLVQGPDGRVVVFLMLGENGRPRVVRVDEWARNEAKYRVRLERARSRHEYSAKSNRASAQPRKSRRNPPSKRLREQLEALPTEALRAHMEALRAADQAMAGSQPRPLAKLYGQRGPTPEQAAKWKADSNAWNRARQKYLAEYKLCVEISNDRFRSESNPRPNARMNGKNKRSDRRHWQRTVARGIERWMSFERPRIAIFCVGDGCELYVEGQSPVRLSSVEEAKRLAPRPGSSARPNVSQSDVVLYQDILAHLLALRGIYRSRHWSVNGSNFYSDHQLFGRLYEGKDGGPSIDKQVDRLGERMVATFGPASVEPYAIEARTAAIVRGVASRDAISSLLNLEQSFQQSVRRAWEKNNEAGHSLGLDTLLADLADDREIAGYLLRRRSE